ncbi:MAG TPA: aldo/keto reductase [Alphaproteobacteria bacterium]|nr:aldo/keto reductase [Alphaproteobacteria bacterium]
MRIRPVGRSGLLVSELCLGTMVFGEAGSRGTPPDEAVRLIHRFLDAGGNYLDTANVYAGGLSEEIVGRALQGGRRHDVVVATKARFQGERLGRDNRAGLSRQAVMRAAEDSLRRLGTNHIDLYYMHAEDPLTPIEESLRAYEDLVRAGKVRYLGVSNFSAWRLMKALATSDRLGLSRFVAAQYQYSLTTRDIEPEFLPLFAEEGLGLHPWSPLGGGFLSGKYRPEQRPDGADGGRLAVSTPEQEEHWDRRATERNWNTLAVLRDVADAHGASVAQAALAWLLARPTVCSVILGVRTAAQLEDNLKAAALRLTPEELAALDAASEPARGYPYRFLAEYAARPL